LQFLPVIGFLVCVRHLSFKKVKFTLEQTPNAHRGVDV
jgi:hypothetical protein